MGSFIKHDDTKCKHSTPPEFRIRDLYHPYKHFTPNGVGLQPIQRIMSKYLLS